MGSVVQVVLVGQNILGHGVCLAFVQKVIFMLQLVENGVEILMKRADAIGVQRRVPVDQVKHPLVQELAEDVAVIVVLVQEDVVVHNHIVSKGHSGADLIRI